MRLTAWERRLTAELFEVILPAGEPRLPEVGVGCSADAYLTDLAEVAPPRLWLGLRLFLIVVALSPPLLLGRLTTFSGLGAAERLQLLRTMKASRFYVLREIPLFFKALACFCRLSPPAVQARLGLEPRDASPPTWSAAP
ncbi:MAG: hypothetical protein R3B13_29025 [Polyangiaceae bacterium]